MACGYIAKLNETVTREHARFDNRYGIAIAENLRRAKDLGEATAHPALAAGGKELQA